ncbi:hypothetical protein [Mesorhizobium sp. YM1C-6-2]|uniref:hypothetical protein n=1 Tax=Mesorhizobium sp. YM1C-6-2 TaxID=1827501 RepID=UPI0011C38D2F|nr:hypothetical protein [Mesorhizobium sp. YM1C-6-2]
MEISIMLCGTAWRSRPPSLPAWKKPFGSVAVRTQRVYKLCGRKGYQKAVQRGDPQTFGGIPKAPC